ncbi:MAG: EAL domain-containing protein [Acidimicrobiia bacterium]|nr:EAL domain-containing protein [Acidimicrobiia bacterium]
MTAAVIVAAVVLAAAVWQASEALEERRVAAEAVDLQLATLSVASADALNQIGQPMPLEELAASMSRLGGDRSLALHALSPDERAEADALLDKISRSGSALIEAASSDRADTDYHRTPAERDYHRLSHLLSEAADRAELRASEAEHRRGISLVLLAVSLLVTGWVVVWARSRAARRRAEAEAELRAGRRLERLLNDSPDILLVVDEVGRITYRSASADRLLPPGPCSRAELRQLLAEDDRAALDEHLAKAYTGSPSRAFQLVDHRGEKGWFELRVSDLTGEPLVNGILVTLRDVTNEVNLRHDLFAQANTDVLTGLPNRRVLDRVLDDAAIGLMRGRGSVALVSLDLDGFKDVNDTLGHAAGDELLTQMAERLQRATRSEDILLRLGGDEFAALLTGLNDEGQAVRVAERYLEVLSQPVRLRSRIEQLRTSIGVALATEPERVRSLVTEADLAMYVAKRAGGSRIRLFEPSMEDETVAASRIGRALRMAHYDTEFSLVYQPIVTVDGHRLIGLEALLRWDSPRLGRVPPDQFIPLAERSGDICAIGDWVLDHVCRQIQQWEGAGYLAPNLTVSCNVSPRQLVQADFVSRVLATTAARLVAPNRLVVEITESAVLDGTGVAVERLHELRSAGVRISIDDFGSGYSNLGQLLHVPFDVLKIDRSLLLRLSEMRAAAGADGQAPCAIMEAIVSIASVFDAPVVCEGVETDAQRQSLAASGVTHVQGYLTGRPAGADETAELLRGAVARRAQLVPVEEELVAILTNGTATGDH